MKTIHISKTGKHRAMNGTTVDFTESVLQAAADAYDPSLHPAPIVVGHPKTDMPAYGWVKGLSFADGDLTAEPEQVEAQFEEMVQAGRFKTVSASFYSPDQHGNPSPGTFYLKHVGFLGAAAPAIKGLKQVEFAATEDGITIEFAAPTSWNLNSIAAMFRNVREMVVEKFGREEADKTLPNWQVAELEQAARAPENDNKAVAEPAFSEPHNEPQQENETMTPEEIAAKEQELQQREDRLKQQEAQGKKDEAAQFSEGLVKQGKLLPAQQAAVTSLLTSLSTETAVEFAEGDSTVSKSQAQAFKDLLTALPQQIEFSEVAGNEHGDPPAAGQKQTAEFAEDLTGKV